MAESRLKIDVRRNKILEELRQEGKVFVSRLSESLGATPVTIRNDLAALEKDGYLIRMQGGAVLSQRPANLFACGAENNDSAVAQKREIARAAVSLIEDGDTLFINSGSTTRQIARALREKKNLNIVTNSLAVALDLGNIPGFRVLLLGGEINATYEFTYGGDAQEQLGKYQADWAVLSVDGVSAASGITTHHAEEAIIDRLMIGNSRKVIIAADKSKIGRAGFTRVCDADAKVWLVTDGACPREALNQLVGCGVNVPALVQK